LPLRLRYLVVVAATDERRAGRTRHDRIGWTFSRLEYCYWAVVSDYSPSYLSAQRAAVSTHCLG